MIGRRLRSTTGRPAVRAESLRPRGTRDARTKIVEDTACRVVTQIVGAVVGWLAEHPDDDERAARLHRPLQMVGVLGRQHDDRAAGTQAAETGHGVGEQGQQSLGRRSAVGENVVTGLRGEHSNRRPAGLESACHGQWLPGAGLLVFGEAQRVFAWPALRGLVQHTRLTSETVEQYQPERAADRRIRPEAGAEQVRPAVDAEPLTNGAIHDDHEGRPAGARGWPVQLEGGIGEGTQRRADDGKVPAGIPP